MLLGHFTSRILNRDVTTVYTSEDLDSESGRFLGLQVLTLESPVVTICTTQWRTEGGGLGCSNPPEILKISVESSIAQARRTGVSISFYSSLCSHTVVIY